MVKDGSSGFSGQAGSPRDGRTRVTDIWPDVTAGSQSSAAYFRAWRMVPGGEFGDKLHNRLIDLLAPHVEEVVVVGAIDPERGDGPAGLLRERFAHRKGDQSVPAAVANQDWARDLGDLVNAVEAVAEQDRDGKEGTIRLPISTPLVNEEKAINPATCRSPARSMATAPPKDQPAAMIWPGAILRRRRDSRTQPGPSPGSRSWRPCRCSFHSRRIRV